MKRADLENKRYDPELPRKIEVLRQEVLGLGEESAFRKNSRDTKAAGVS